MNGTFNRRLRKPSGKVAQTFGLALRRPSASRCANLRLRLRSVFNSHVYSPPPRARARLTVLAAFVGAITDVLRGAADAKNIKYIVR
jgi:hypothetical protein